MPIFLPKPFLSNEQVPEDEGQNIVLAQRKEQSISPPSMYKVILMNDDFTPMEFVVRILQSFFGHDLKAATLIMLKIHHEGRAVCGVFTKDIAATKVELVLNAAKKGGHPLQCTMEAT